MNLDLHEQWQRLRENYAQMTEDELALIANKAYDLTTIAQEALQAEISERKVCTPITDFAAHGT